MATRLSPSISATSVEDGTIAPGNDRRLWVAVTASNGVQRWVPYTHVKKNGLRILTANFLEDNIGRPVRIYERPASLQWPTSKRGKDMYSYIFIPSGSATPSRRKKSIPEWLITRKPSVRSGELYFIDGVHPEEPEGDAARYYGLSLDPVGQEVVASNLRNMQSFVSSV